MDDDEIEIDFSKIGKKIKSLFSSGGKKEKDDEEIDLSEVTDFFKNNKQIIFYALLAGVIFLGAWMRTLSIPHYHGMLLGLDPYVFYRYATYLVNNGSLPYTDNLRYFPEGFLTFREHQVHTYFIAGLYEIFHPLFGGKLIDYATIYPVVAFVISMFLFFLMSKELFDKKTALIATSFLSLAPSYLFRTIAGFADKEPMATMFWFATIYALIKAVKTKNTRNAVLYGIASGVLGGLAGLTWGGVNLLFNAIGATFLFLALINRLSNKNSLVYYLWYSITILMNAFLSLRYGGFPSILKHQIFLVSTAAAGIILFKIIYSLVRHKSSNYHFLATLAITIIAGLVVLQVTGLFDVAGEVKSIVGTINHPFGTCPFCVSVTENQAPYFYDPIRGVDWWSRLQWFIPLFVTGALLLMMESLKKFKKDSIIVTGSFMLFVLFFMFSRFVNSPGYEWINTFFSATYMYTLIIFGAALSVFYLLRPNSKGWSELTIPRLFVLSWFSLNIIATRGAVRIIFASTPVFILLAAYSLTKIHDIISRKTKDVVYSGIPYLIAITLIIWSFLASIGPASSYSPSFTSDWNTSMTWVRENTPENAVFTHWWDYGYWVQTMSERTTTVDGGNYKVNWDEIIGGKMFSGYNLTEVYNSLDYFRNNVTGQRPDYLLIMDDDVLKYVQMANIGGRPGFYAPLAYYQLMKNTVYPDKNYTKIAVFKLLTNPGMLGKDVLINNKLFADKQSYVVNVLIPMTDNQSFGPVLGYIYNTYTGESAVARYDCVCHYSKGCTHYNLNNSIPACIEFVKGGLIHIPHNLEKRFMTQIYLLNKTIPGFELVYNSPAPLSLQGMVSQQDPTDIKIYHINYTEMKKWVDNGTPAW